MKRSQADAVAREAEIVKLPDASAVTNWFVLWSFSVPALGT